MTRVAYSVAGVDLLIQGPTELTGKLPLELMPSRVDARHRLHEGPDAVWKRFFGTIRDPDPDQLP